ncbi:hypothetical protein ACWEV3_19780 [Saccharopolyspora sp. NPDC003752]
MVTTGGEGDLAQLVEREDLSCQLDNRASTALAEAAGLKLSGKREVISPAWQRRR